MLLHASISWLFFSGRAAWLPHPYFYHPVPHIWCVPPPANQVLFHQPGRVTGTVTACRGLRVALASVLQQGPRGCQGVSAPGNFADGCELLNR